MEASGSSPSGSREHGVDWRLPDEEGGGMTREIAVILAVTLLLLVIDRTHG